MKHITHTGYFAGVTFCGIARHLRGVDDGAHLPYSTNTDLWVDKHIDCIECSKVYHEEFKEIAAEIASIDSVRVDDNPIQQDMFKGI